VAIVSQRHQDRLTLLPFPLGDFQSFALFHDLSLCLFPLLERLFRLALLHPLLAERDVFFVVIVCYDRGQLGAILGRRDG
jgi:hypothetical protein